MIRSRTVNFNGVYGWQWLMNKAVGEDIKMKVEGERAGSHFQIILEFIYNACQN